VFWVEAAIAGLEKNTLAAVNNCAVFIESTSDQNP
jgi:hypothetical protein